MSTDLIALTPRKDKFGQGVSFAKKIGCRFDAERKVWLRSAAALWDFVDGCRYDKTREQYLRINGLELVGQAADAPSRSADYAADHWVGQASMDHPDSAF